jgi:AcrR family transcriptional regulator
MARPRKVGDEQVYEAAFRVMQRRGPSEWTLAEVAAAAGLTAGALVQRYGSKRALQVELIAQFAEGATQAYEGLLARHASPLAAVRAYAAELACLAGTPEGFAHHLDYLRLDLTDPEMHVHFRRQAEAARSFLREALERAVAARELKSRTDVAALARMLETAVTGSLFTWATYREGEADAWLKHDLDAVLVPYVRRPRNREARSGGGASSKRA